MGSLQNFWSDASVENISKYLILLAIPTNLLLWGCERWALCTSVLNKLELFLHISIQHILCIKISVVKEEQILWYIQDWTTDFNMRTNLNYKTDCNSDNQLITNILTSRCNHKIQRGGILHMYKMSIFQNIRLIIPEVDKTAMLNTWAQFYVD